MHPVPGKNSSLSFAVLLLALLLLAACQTDKRVVILVDGERRVAQVQAGTVDEALKAENIALGEQDRVEPPGYTPIERTANIRVVRVEIVTEKKSEPVEYERQVMRDESFPSGEMRVLQMGTNGEQEVTYQVTREDGREVSRREIGRVTMQESRPEIIAEGTGGSLPAVSVRGALVYLAHGNAWVIRDSSSARRPLTYSGDLDGRVFALSPNGRYLLFTRAESGHLNTLWATDTLVLGDVPRPISINDLLYAEWAADGSPRFAYSTGEKTEGAPGWKAHNDLLIATVYGLGAQDRASLPAPTAASARGRPVLPTPAPSPTVSSSGRITVAVRTVLTPAVPGPLGWWGSSLAWSPDGNVLAYALADRMGFINVSTGARSVQKAFPFYRTRAEWVWTPSVSWSPDSRFVVMPVHGAQEGAGTPEDSPVFDDWVIARDNSLALPLVSGAGMWSAPMWSPVDVNGESKIAYGVSMDEADTERSPYALYIINRDGSGRRKILPQAGEAGVKSVQLAWSPDALELAAVRDGDLWLYDLASGRWSQLTSNGDTHLPRWK